MATISKSKIEELKKALFSNDEILILKSLERCREAGTVAMVEPLLVLYSSSTSEEVKSEIASILGSLKVSGVEPFFMEALSNPDMKAIRKEIISFMWNSGIQPKENMVEITRIAAKGSFEEALESLTLLDSLDNVLPEEIILECITIVKQQLAIPANDQHQLLLRDYLAALESMRMTDEE